MIVAPSWSIGERNSSGLSPSAEGLQTLQSRWGVVGTGFRVPALSSDGMKMVYAAER